MYCKNCGKPMNDNQAICLNCGVNAGCGNKFCANCGEPVNENAAVCTHCGVAIKKIAQPQAGAVLSKEEAYKKLAEYEKNSGNHLVCYSRAANYRRHIYLLRPCACGLLEYLHGCSAN